MHPMEFDVPFEHAKNAIDNPADIDWGALKREFRQMNIKVHQETQTQLEFHFWLIFHFYRWEVGHWLKWRVIYFVRRLKKRF